MQLLLTIGLTAVALTLLVRYGVKRVVVFEYERGILYAGGKLQGVIGPGAYWSIGFNRTILKIDMRPRFVSIVGQEVLSADNVGLKLSLAAKYQVVDPLMAAHASTDYQEALYLELQLALRMLVGAVKIDALLEQRELLSAQVLERTAPAIEALGLKLLSVGIKDIMFPGDLKRMFAQIVKAQKEGLAALEKARGESAALRHLANAAKLLENNPTLMQLRLLQTVGDGSGNTVVLGMPGQTTPLPIKAEGATGGATNAPD